MNAHKSEANSLTVSLGKRKRLATLGQFWSAQSRRKRLKKNYNPNAGEKGESWARLVAKLVKLDLS